MTCSSARELLPLHFYGLVEGAECHDLDRHLALCAACSSAWEETRAVLGSVDAGSAFPREAEVDWSRFAREVADRARWADRRRALVRPVLAWGSLGALAAALLVVAGLRVLRAPAPGAGAMAPPAVTAVSPESARFLQEGLARQGAARYLRDSRALLVDLVHAPVPCRRADGSLDIALEKERAQDLLRRKNLYLDALAGVRDQRLADLVRQLESLLVQVSSLNDCAAALQIHDLREEIERRQILLRIDLVAGEVEGGSSHA